MKRWRSPPTTPGLAPSIGTAWPSRLTRKRATTCRRSTAWRDTSTKVPGTNIYKTTEVVDGREVPHYSDHKPSDGGYEVVKRNRVID